MYTAKAISKDEANVEVNITFTHSFAAKVNEMLTPALTLLPERVKQA